MGSFDRSLTVVIENDSAWRASPARTSLHHERCHPAVMVLAVARNQAGPIAAITWAPFYRIGTI